MIESGHARLKPRIRSRAKKERQTTADVARDADEQSNSGLNVELGRSGGARRATWYFVNDLCTRLPRYVRAGFTLTTSRLNGRRDDRRPVQQISGARRAFETIKDTF